MTRPMTPFTGQRADLSWEEVAPLAPDASTAAFDAAFSAGACVMTSLLRRVVLALECDEQAQTRAQVYCGPTACCAGLGSVIGHVTSTLLRDRRTLSTWLGGRAENPA